MPVPALVRVLALVAAGALAGACAPTARTAFPADAHHVEDSALSEMSGLVASRRQPGLLWSINDSGSLPRLFRLGSRGEALGRVWIHGAWLQDPETLAHWRERGRDWLLIGDVGDNHARRDHVVVHALAEPGHADRRAQIAWSLRFRYPDGARDAEAIAVDPATADVLVLSKRDRPARLYRVPLSARAAAQPVRAEFLGSPTLDAIDGAVTGLDLSDDGRELAVLTYRGLYLWRRAPGDAWAQVLARPPQRLPMPRLAKAEAMALSAQPGTILVGSEKQPTPLWVGATDRADQALAR